MRQAFGGLNNADIAREMGKTEPAIGNYISGKVTLPVIMDIARLTGCSVDWLLTGENRQTKNQASLDETFRTVVREIIQEVLDERETGRIGKNQNKPPEQIVEISSALHFGDEGQGKSKVKPENLARDIERMKNDPPDEE